MCMFAEYFARDALFDFTALDMPQIRIMMANEIHDHQLHLRPNVLKCKAPIDLSVQIPVLFYSYIIIKLEKLQFVTIYSNVIFNI